MRSFDYIFLKMSRSNAPPYVLLYVLPRARIASPLPRVLLTPPPLPRGVTASALCGFTRFGAASADSVQC